MQDKHLTDIQFKSLDLPETLQQGISDAGFEFCTPIQAATLPLALKHQDVAGQAQTGTGKTAAFLLALFNHLIKFPAHNSRPASDPRALILAPTRELAVQIHADAVKLAEASGFKLGLAFGGTDYQKQVKQFEDGVDVLIGTPGRTIDYLKQNVYSLRNIQVMVLDEADRMFDLGFLQDIRFVMRRLPPSDKRLNLLFSATLSHRVLELAYEHMNSPELVKIDAETITADNVSQVMYFPSNHEKLPLLIGILRDLKESDRSIVFVNTKRASEIIECNLTHNGMSAAILSGDVPQKKRLSLLKAFTDKKINVLVATDVASRGLHIPDVTHVINFDLPDDVEDYVHRIGRTARAGSKGDAISFGCEDYAINLPAIESYIKQKIPVAPITSELLAKFDYVRPKRKPRPAHGGRNSRGSNNNRRHKKPYVKRSS